MTGPPCPYRERRKAARDLKRGTTIRPAVAGDFGPHVAIPFGSTFIVEDLAPRVRWKRLILPDGNAG